MGLVRLETGICDSLLYDTNYMWCRIKEIIQWHFKKFGFFSDYLDHEFVEWIVFFKEASLKTVFIQINFLRHRAESSLLSCCVILNINLSKASSSELWLYPDKMSFNLSTSLFDRNCNLLMKCSFDLDDCYSKDKQEQ